MKESREEILRDRGAKYGPNPFNQATIGRAWSAILMSWLQKELPDVPPHVVALMMAELKIQRWATPFEYSEDNLSDGQNYLEIAGWCDPRSPTYKGDPVMPGKGTSKNFPHGKSVKNPATYEALKRSGKSKGSAAAISNSALNKGYKKGVHHGGKKK